MSSNAVIVAARRSPIGRAGKGSLAQMRPDELAHQVLAATLESVPELDPETIDDIHIGCAQAAGEAGYNLARVLAVLGGLDGVPGTTVNRYCSSSLQTTRMAYHAIRAGEADVVVSGGVETVSRHVHGRADGMPDTHNSRFEEAGQRTKLLAAGEGIWTDPRRTDELPDLYIGMGQTAENVAQAYGVSRADQDEFAVLSQRRAVDAARTGFWAREIAPVTLPDGTAVTADDGPRPGTTREKLAALTPVFREQGTVTAGNCCPLNDGAAMVMVMGEDKARALGCTPLARIVATSVSALSPEIMGMGPVEATRRVLDRAGLTIADIDLVEMNEAFAAQVLACQRELDIPLDRLNVNGGAIALGHPFGMTGARITTTLINSLRTHDKQFGLETMCVGGGQGMAMVIERLH